MRNFSMNFGPGAPRLAAVVGLASSARTTCWAGDGVVQSSLAWGRQWFWALRKSPQTDNHRALHYCSDSSSVGEAYHARVCLGLRRGTRSSDLLILSHA